MTREPSGKSGCCLPRVAGVSYLRIGPEQYVVGMVELQAIFEQLQRLGRGLEDVTDAELIDMARKSNYIPNSAGAEADYALALRSAYATFCGRPGRQRPGAKR